MHNIVDCRNIAQKSLWTIRFTILILASFAFHTTLLGQTFGKVIMAEIKQANSDSQKAKIFDKAYRHYQFSNQDSGGYFLKKGLSLFTTNKYKPGIALMLTGLGNVYSTQGMLNLARKTAEEALNIYNDLSDSSGIANVNNVLGVIEGRRSNYPEATGHFLFALGIFERLKDTDAIVNTYIKLGTANDFSGSLDKSLDYYNKGLAIMKGRPSNRNVIFLNNNAGSIYSKKGDFTTALKYVNKALDGSTDPALAQIRILPLTNMGVILSKMNKIEDARIYLEQALGIAENENLPEDKARLLLNISSLNIQTDTNKALAQMNEALVICRRIGQKKLASDVLEGLIVYYKDKKDFEKAFTLQEEEKNLLDSIFSIDKETAIANLESMHEVNELNSKIQQLELSEKKQKSRKVGVLVIAGCLLIILLIVFYLFWNTKKLNKELSARRLDLKNTIAIKDKLFSIIGHDLIGPIGYMPIVFELILDESTDEEERVAFLRMMEKNAIACYETMQNLMNWGKAQMDGISLSQVNLNLKEATSQELELINLSAVQKGVKISNDIPTGLEAYVDINHYAFIIRNLVSNAIKYTKQGGCVFIDARPEAGMILLSVKDNGIGMKPEKMEHIFESLGVTTMGTSREKGHGLGLKFCRDFVEENGGKIWVESSPGVGTTFFFTLKPRVDGE